MDAVALDPIAAIAAAPEGRYEWVGGSLVEMAPPPSNEHNDEGLFLAAILRAYAEQHRLGRVFMDGFAQRLGENVRVPDVAFFREEGLDRIKKTHSEGGADLIVEIVSPESRGRDRGDKYYDYEQAGVEEYWIIDTERRSAEFYRLSAGRYAPVIPDPDGVVRSSVLPGFVLRVAWLWERPNLIDALRELELL